MEPSPFPYMRWAKAHLNGAWGPSNLGMSGVQPPTAAERAAWGLPPALGIGLPRADLKARLSEASGMPPEGIHCTAGTSHANFVACLALARGGRLAVEQPAYQALPRLATAIGAAVSPVRRDPARGWRLDADSIAAAVDAGTDLFLVTDLHNPSGRRLEPEDLDRLVQAAVACDAYVLVDEVYQAFDPALPRTAALLDDRILTTNSLTKTHGLGDLRCGWILGAPEIIARIEAWDDLVHPEQPPAMLAAAAAYLPHAPARHAALRNEAAARIEQVDAWVASTEGVSWSRPHGGITGFLELAPGIDGDRLAAHLLEHDGLRVVPGSFFDHPQAIRISYQLPPADLARALEALGKTLAREALA